MQDRTSVDGFLEATRSLRSRSRLSEEARLILHEAHAARSLTQLATSLAELLDVRPYRERCVSTRLDPVTGDPIKFEWVPSEQWNGRLWIDYSWNGLAISSSEPLFELLRDALNGQMVIALDGNRYLLIHFSPQRDEGSLKRGGTKPPHFTLSSGKIK